MTQQNLTGNPDQNVDRASVSSDVDPKASKASKCCATPKEKVRSGNFLFLFFLMGWVYLAQRQIRSPDLNELPVLEVELWFKHEYNSYVNGIFRDLTWIPVVASIVYLWMVFQLPKYLPAKGIPHTRPLLIVWNAFLSVFSMWGGLRILPNVLVRNEFFICGDAEAFCNAHPHMCFWLFAFCMSKIPEMIDTLFLVLRRREVIFLHWYHHVSVMWFCWICWTNNAVVGQCYAAMNLIVHTFMYFYYTLAALGLRPWRWANYITLVQISQMFGGVILSVYIVAYNETCKAPRQIRIAGIVIYGSYLYLFVKFFWDRNFKSRPRAFNNKKND